MSETQMSLFEARRAQIEATRGDSIDVRFVRFHEANPEVWRLFCHYSFELVKRGRQHYSADMVCHRIRWHTTVETTGDPFKINDHFTSRYARLWAKTYPEHADLFEMRVLHA